MALRVLDQAGTAETRNAARKARSWLRTLDPDNVPAAATILLASAQEGNTTERLKRAVSTGGEPVAEWNSTSAYKTEQSLNLIRRAQSRDGGWGPYADSPPEVFDTALALLALEKIRPGDAIEEIIRRGRSFLVATQNPDGSWPATTRPSGGESYAQRISTTGWAALALLATRSYP
jgi:hypothetical protein